MNVNKRKKYPHLSRFGFWDVDQSNLDYDKYAKFVIIWVMERGSEEDVKEIARYYGKKKIINELTSAPSLLPTGVKAGKHYYKLKDEDFKCFTSTRRRKNLSMF